LTDCWQGFAVDKKKERRNESMKKQRRAASAVAEAVAVVVVVQTQPHWTFNGAGTFIIESSWQRTNERANEATHARTDNLLSFFPSFFSRSRRRR